MSFIHKYPSSWLAIIPFLSSFTDLPMKKYISEKENNIKMSASNSPVLRCYLLPEETFPDEDSEDQVLQRWKKEDQSDQQLEARS